MVDLGLQFPAIGRPGQASGINDHLKARNQEAMEPTKLIKMGWERRRQGQVMEKRQKRRTK